MAEDEEVGIVAVDARQVGRGEMHISPRSPARPSITASLFSSRQLPGPAIPPRSSCPKQRAKRSRNCPNISIAAERRRLHRGAKRRAGPSIEMSNGAPRPW